MEAASTMQQAEAASRRAKDHPVLEMLAGAGLVAYGLVYGLIGWLALKLAFGDRERSVSKNGALRELASQPMGQVLLWAAAVGFAALTLRSALLTFTGDPTKRGLAALAARAASVVRMCIYAVLGVSAAKVALGQSSKANPRGYTAKVFDLPFGAWIVWAVGLSVMGYALVSIWTGLADKWKDDAEPRALTGATGVVLPVLARVGYCARGVAFGIVGALFVWAAVTHDADKSGGLDQALSRLLQAPAGPALLTVVAGGFICYGLYNVVLAKYHRA